MIRAISILLILWGCAFAQASIEITSSTPMGMPCGGISTVISTVGCMPDAQCGWMVVLKTGDAAAFSGKLTYTDAEGKEQTATATAAATGEYTALAFRVGVFRPSTGNRFVAVEVSSLKASATVRQDAEGAIITVGETTWGPPKQAHNEKNGWPIFLRREDQQTLADMPPKQAGGPVKHRIKIHARPDGTWAIEPNRLSDGSAIAVDIDAAAFGVHSDGMSLPPGTTVLTIRGGGPGDQSSTGLKEYK